MITNEQNVAINLSKAFHLLAVALGDTATINNAQEHLDCALDGGVFDFDASKHALTQCIDKLIESTKVRVKLPA